MQYVRGSTTYRRTELQLTVFDVDDVGRVLIIVGRMAREEGSPGPGLVATQSRY